MSGRGPSGPGYRKEGFTEMKTAFLFAGQGSQAPGMAADCFLINLDRLSLVGAQFDPMSLLGTVGFKGNVDYTIVNGRPVVQHGELVTADEEEIIARSNEAVSRYLGR